MNQKYYLLLLLLFCGSFAFAQSSFTERAELGFSLFSVNNEKQANSTYGGGYRYNSGSIFNGFIFKYHKKRYTFRIHLRVIGVQGSGGDDRRNGLDFGDNYADVGFQLGTGFEKKIVENKRWKWYAGGEMIFIRVVENDFFGDQQTPYLSYEGYSIGALNLITGIQLKASRHLSFIWEMNQVVGVLTRKKSNFNKREWLGQGYFNPAGIFGVTISWNKQK